MPQTLRPADVYGITRELPLNYVERTAVDGDLLEALSRDQHLVIYGSSKQGKTSVRKHSLRDDDYIVVTCSNKWNLGQLHSAILKQAGYTVTQSETKTTSGHFKISARISAAAKFFGNGMNADAGGEGGTATSNSHVVTPLELDPYDVNDIISALAEIVFQQWIVLEDFHYLPEETQRDFAVALKAFHESSALTFIVIGVWLQENRLTQFNGDLSGRIKTINADTWTRSELSAAIREGERLLHIRFGDEFREALLTKAFDSIYIVQESCLMACQDAGVTAAGSTLVEVRPKNPAAIISAVVNKQSAMFNEFIVNFATGFGRTDLEMYRWLLAVLTTAPPSELELGLQYREIRRLLATAHPRGEDLNAGNVTQALKSVASLQVHQGTKPLVLDYDQSLRRLNVVNRSFIVWLEQQTMEDMADLLDLDFSVVSRLRETHLEKRGAEGDDAVDSGEASS